MLSPYRASGEGTCPVMVHYEADGAVCDVALGEWLAPENVRLIFG